METGVVFGEFLKQMRIRAGLSQAQLAKELGNTQGQISAWEGMTGLKLRHSVVPKFIRNLVKTLQISVVEIAPYIPALMDDVETAILKSGISLSDKTAMIDLYEKASGRNSIFLFGVSNDIQNSRGTQG